MDENGWSALHYAAACCDGLAAVHFFCELVPELIDSQCSEGNAALHVAAACGCVENVRALLETAARPAIVNASGQTPYRLALLNNKIQCALTINENQQPQQVYDHECKSYMFEEEERAEPNIFTAVGANISPLDNWGATGGSLVPEKVKAGATEANGEWVECVTEDGLPYYYNTITGASSWFKAAVPAPEDLEFWGNEADTKADAFSHSTPAPYMEHPHGRTGSALGQELPLCLIPMVSPLTSLDNPTAATKLAAQRQKTRERRHKRLGQQRRGRSGNG